MSRIWKWLDNYWYHYKWPTIIVSFFLILGIILTVQMLQKVDYDAYIMYIGEDAIPNTQYEDILTSFDKVVMDSNGDKEIHVNFSRTPFIADESNPMAGSINTNTIQFMSTMIVQPYYLYLIHKDVYEQYKDKELFVPLTELLDIEEDLFYDEQAILFGKTEFAKKNAGVDRLDSEILLVLKNVPYSPSASTVAAEKKAFHNHATVLENIVNYTKGEE